MSVITRKSFETEIGTVSLTAYYMNCRDGFNHLADMWVNYKPVVQNQKIHYINRTWERYDGQSVMMSAVRGIQDDRKAELKAKYLTDNNYGRLTPKRKEELEVIFNNDPYIKAYESVIDQLN